MQGSLQSFVSALAVSAFLVLPLRAEPGDLPAPPDVAAPPAAAEVTATGLASVVLEPGEPDGPMPGPTDIVVVDYTGWTTDGKLFDSSVARGKPVRLRLDTVIQGWTEGLQLMRQGEKRRLWIPEELAYAGLEGRPQGMLVFDVDLLEVVQPPPAPENVAGPPADAEQIREGLWSVVLEPGDGGEHPTPHGTVLVHYSGWTTDGELFDTTALRGEPASFQLDKVIKGWRYGLREMEQGEKRRFWVDEKLAYKGQEGPQGMLVFDIELLAVN
ncbi:MAG: FKBP-type peptidyl-prolyl cis-trans isomerase [Thermoanaerobaculia bacterium]